MTALVGSEPPTIFAPRTTFAHSEFCFVFHGTKRPNPACHRSMSAVGGVKQTQYAQLEIFRP